jgi:hypothetical protein
MSTSSGCLVLLGSNETNTPSVNHPGAANSWQQASEVEENATLPAVRGGGTGLVIFIQGGEATKRFGDGYQFG